VSLKDDEKAEAIASGYTASYGFCCNCNCKLKTL